MAIQRAGLRARPPGLPWWLRVARRVLAGLRHKHLSAYVDMRCRLVEALPKVAAAMGRIQAGALAATTGRTYFTNTDADRLCAVVIEALAWWAVEDRTRVRAIRDARGELLALQDRIEAAVTELCAAVERTDELRSQFGLVVNLPMWHNDLGEVFAEACKRFPRWGTEPEVKALEAFEARSWYSPRPRVLDLVLIARNVGAMHTVADSQPVRGADGAWLRTSEPWVSAADLQTENALANTAGSGPKKERPQVHQLMAALREIGHANGWDEGAAGPLEFLTDEDLSLLCNIATGGAGVSGLKASDPFDVGNMAKHRAFFRKQ